MNKKIQAYNSLEMWFHKHLIHLMAFLIISGLPILSKSFNFIAYGVGIPINWFTGNGQTDHILASGISFLRVIHLSSGFLLTIVIIPFIFSMLKKINTLSIWPDKWGVQASVDGLIEMKKNYIDLEHAEFGKMNIGQKASAWVMAICTAALMISGYSLLFRELFSAETASLIRAIHAISFIVLAVVLIIHIYFATHPANKAAYKAMFKTGEMDEEYVKEHHSLWYKKLHKL